MDTTTNAAAEAEVRATAQRWSEAIAQRDAATAEQSLGAEYALYAPGIGVMPRDRWLAALPQYVVHEYAFDDVVVHVYGGDAAVMRSRYRQRATVAGQDRSGTMLVTDVWVKRDGRWQVVARHTSWLDQG